MTAVLIALSITMFRPFRTARALEVNTGLARPKLRDFFGRWPNRLLLA